METRLQHLLLKRLAAAAAAWLAAGSLQVQAAGLDIDTEFFELGVHTGLLNLQDFTTEPTFGVSGTFRTTEDFFLQFSYLQADISLSAIEESAQGAFTGERTYRHYNLLLGYNLFQGEVFRGTKAGLSSLYLVGGVGDTEFLDEANFTYVYGLGYQMALSRRFNVRLDYRNYVYDTIVVDQNENSVTNSHWGVGVSWVF